MGARMKSRRKQSPRRKTATVKKVRTKGQRRHRKVRDGKNPTVKRRNKSERNRGIHLRRSESRSTRKRERSDGSRHPPKRKRKRNPKRLPLSPKMILLQRRDL